MSNQNLKAKNMNMIPLVKPFIPSPDVLMPELEKILYSGYIAEGKASFEFEHEFQAFIGNPYSLITQSGTSALHLALLLAGVKPEDEVISTAMTAEPTNTTIAMVGAKVVWADVDLNSGLLDPQSVRSLITPKTKAIMLVHYAGMVCNMVEFNKISNEFNIPIIEDAAHALGSKFDGKYIGNNSPYTIFSFQAIKHMTTLDGGCLSVKTEKNYELGKIKRWFGLDKSKPRLLNDITEIGFKYNMNNVNATIGLVQMRYLDDILRKHIDNGKFYDNNLMNIPGLELVNYYDKTEPSYWLYTMKVEDRDNFIKMMSENGILASPLHLRSDRHSIFKESKKNLPNLDDFYSKLVHIPCGWWVTDENREKIIDAIRKGW